MKINIKTPFFRAALYLGAMTHLRHFRGHGIHSPYAYNLVRNTIYKRRIVGHSRELYDAMRALKMPHRASMQIQNIMHYLRCTSFCMVGTASEIKNYDSETLYLTDPYISTDALMKVMHGVRRAEGSMVVVFPRTDGHRHSVCRRLSATEEFLTIDNRRFTLWQFSHKLPKQHYKL